MFHQTVTYYQDKKHKSVIAHTLELLAVTLFLTYFKGFLTNKKERNKIGTYVISILTKMQRMEKVIFTDIAERKHIGVIVSYECDNEVHPGAD